MIIMNDNHTIISSSINTIINNHTLIMIMIMINTIIIIIIIIIIICIIVAPVHEQMYGRSQCCSQTRPSTNCVIPQPPARELLFMQLNPPLWGFQKCTSKGVWWQGIALKHRNSLRRSLCPVFICLYLCSSEDRCSSTLMYRSWTFTLNFRTILLKERRVERLFTRGARSPAGHPSGQRRVLDVPRRPGRGGVPSSLWEALKGPPLRVNFEHGIWQLLFKLWSQIAKPCSAARLWNPNRHLFQIDPLPWTLNFLPGSAERPRSWGPPRPRASRSRGPGSWHLNIIIS